MNRNTTTAPQLRWDWGTGYDLFASLFAVYQPSAFGIRASWAAGVRSRIPATSRDVLSDVVGFMGVPVHWLLDQGEPKDARSVIARLESVPPGCVLEALTLNPRFPEEPDLLLREISRRRRVTPEDRRAAAGCQKLTTGEAPGKERIAAWLKWWAKPEEFGRLYVRGLKEYYDGFFGEEECRIAPALAESVERAQSLAQSLPVSEFFEELTQGLKLESVLNADAVYLIPSFWTSPLILYGDYAPKVMMVVYGARPKDASLVPGDVVPDSLSLALSALSDNTRLRILKMLARSPRTQIEIARTLRLRAPTITHHLRNLRLAGLVRLSVSAEGEKLYSTRRGRLREITHALREFLRDEEP